MELTLLGILSITLLGIILFFFFKLRSMLVTTPGARQDMGTKDLIKNWQNNKQKENEYQNELKQRARESAKAEIEEVLMDRYKQEAIKQATQTKAENFAEKLGVNSKDFFSKDKIDRMTGGRQNIDVGQGIKSENIISQDRINNMLGKGIDSGKIKDAAHSRIDYGGNVKGALQSKSIDIDKILKRKL